MKRFKGEIRYKKEVQADLLGKGAKPEFKPLLERIGSLDKEDLEGLESGDDGLFSDVAHVERALVSCLRHEEYEIVRAAGEALGDLVGESHKWELIGLTLEERQGTATYAARLLRKIDDGTIIPVLLDIFEETYDFGILASIGRIANPSAIPKLEECLGSDDEWLRMQAMQAMQTLMEMRRPEANDIFVRMMRDTNTSVACGAAMGLAFAGTSTEVPAILGVFAERNARLPKTAGLPRLKREPHNGMTFGMGELYPNSADRPHILVGQPVSNIAHALGEIGDKRAVPALLEVAKTTPHDLVRAACVGALAKIGGVDYSFFIERLGRWFSDSVRSAAESGLRKIECLPELYTTYLGAEAQLRSRIKRIITGILSRLKTPEDVAELFVHFDIALERGEKIKTADDLSELDVRLMNEGIYNAAKAAEKRLAEKRE